MKPITRIGDVIVPDQDGFVVVNGGTFLPLEMAACMSPSEMDLYAQICRRCELFWMFGEGPPPSPHDVQMLEVICQARKKAAQRREVNQGLAQRPRPAHPLRAEARARASAIRADNPILKRNAVAEKIADRFTREGTDAPSTKSIGHWIADLWGEAELF